MDLFQGKKEKKVFWIYISLSLIVFVLSAFFQELKYRNISDAPTGNEVVRGFELTVLAILIPSSYLIILAFFILRVQSHRKYLKRYQSFKDLSEEEQNNTLQKSFCTSCRIYNSSTFESEEMIEGMRWISLKCKNCNKKNRLRLS